MIAACAIKCLRGGFQAQVVNKDGTVNPKVHNLEELVKGPCAFAATGITNGSLLRGVRYTSQAAVTYSLFVRYESGTVRWITAYHGN